MYRRRPEASGRLYGLSKLFLNSFQDTFTLLTKHCQHFNHYNHLNLL